MTDDRERPELQRERAQQEAESGGEAVRRPVVDVPRAPAAPGPPVSGEPPPNGVTCGVHSSSGEWYSTILQPGQTERVPFAAR